MMLLAFVLIMAAAFLHAGWNVLAKATKDTLALMWWASFLATLGYGAWLLASSGIYMSPASLLPFVISAVAETGYFATLIRGYSEGDLSLIYPISRGSAPIFAAIGSALFVGEKLPLLGYLGVTVIVVGIFTVSIPMSRSKSLKDSLNLSSLFRNGGISWALASSVFIAVYSITDKIAVAATPPLIYNWWVFIGNTLLWFPIVWGRFRLRPNLQELRTNLRAVIGTAIAMPLAYAAALAALAITSASYVVAGRGFSVVLGAAGGSFLLKESFGTNRTVGAIIMLVGLLLIAFS